MKVSAPKIDSLEGFKAGYPEGLPSGCSSKVTLTYMRSSVVLF